METEEKFPEHQRRIDDAASWLAARVPFISTLFSSMTRKITRKIPTAGVKGMRCWFNPDFMDCLSNEELYFVAAHEALHVAFLHSYRIGDRDPELWNVAGDACINLELVTGTAKLIMPTWNDKLFALYPHGKGAGKKVGDNFGVLMKDVTSDDDAETVYQRLQQKGDGGGGKGPQGGWGGDCDLQPADGDPDEDGEGDVAEIEVVTLVLQAAKTAFASGDKSNLLERIIGIARASTTDWKDELRDTTGSAARNDYSYKRFNRRFIGKGEYLPTLYSEEIGELVVGVDESGSISQHQLDIIAVELTQIVDDVRPSRVVVMYCHTRVHRTEIYNCGEEIRLTLTESGGTDMREIPNEVERMELNPAACIIFTDLETPFPTIEPTYPLLWGAVGASRDTKPPVGRRVEVPV